jgi:hypothetical protein
VPKQSGYTWTVNGVVGGNSVFGTIAGEGNYTAPAAVPSPATFTICATQGTLTGCAQVTVTSTSSQHQIRFVPSSDGPTRRVTSRPTAGGPPPIDQRE